MPLGYDPQRQETPCGSGEGQPSHWGDQGLCQCGSLRPQEEEMKRRCERETQGVKNDTTHRGEDRKELRAKDLHRTKASKQGCSRRLGPCLTHTMVWKEIPYGFQHIVDEGHLLSYPPLKRVLTSSPQEFPRCVPPTLLRWAPSHSYLPLPSRATGPLPSSGPHPAPACHSLVLIGLPPSPAPSLSPGCSSPCTWV